MVAQNQAQAIAVAAGAPAEVTLFEPAEPVYALGRRAQGPQGRAQIADALAACQANGIAIVDVDRGGLGTLHAPGQIVAFLAVPCSRLHARRLCAELLSGIARLAQEQGAEARSDLGDDVGVWIADAKLASLGLRVRDEVAHHGIALNYAVDRRLARGLVLCGKPLTTFANLRDHALDQNVDLAFWAQNLAQHWRLATPSTAAPEIA